MNAVTKGEAHAAINAVGDSIPLRRARLYHFLGLALAHPGEEGFDYFAQDVVEKEFLDIYGSALAGDDALLAKGLRGARAWFHSLRARSYAQVEAAHIELFSANYPHLPCPPYGSIFTASDTDKRLDEMLAIKACYQENGVDMSESFDDLPDHLCVELEFLQLLCFREHDAAAAEQREVLAGVRDAQRSFLDRFLLPLGENLVRLATGAMPDNFYGALLETLDCLLLRHRQTLDAST